MYPLNELRWITAPSRSSVFLTLNFMDPPGVDPCVAALYAKFPIFFYGETDVPFGILLGNSDTDASPVAGRGVVSENSKSLLIRIPIVRLHLTLPSSAH